MSVSGQIVNFSERVSHAFSLATSRGSHALSRRYCSMILATCMLMNAVEDMCPRGFEKKQSICCFKSVTFGNSMVSQSSLKYSG